MAGEVIAFDLKQQVGSNHIHKPMETVARELTEHIGGAALLGYERFDHVPFTDDDLEHNRNTDVLLVFVDRRGDTIATDPNA